MLNRHSVWTRAALLFVSLSLLAVPAMSQSFYGSLISVTQDAQGGVIPGATVVLTNTATNERRESVSAEDGTARFVNLVPGTYRLEVELTGFQRFVRDGIAVNIQTTPRIEATLQLGSLQETVSVTGESPLLQTENASVGTVVGSRAVQELPLNGRNVLNLIAVAPSVVPQGGSEGSLTGKNVFAAGNYQIGGGVANQSASLYDGVPLQDMAYGNIVVLTPSPEAVEEFRVQTNNSSAEFGRFTGGVVNIASRYGHQRVSRQHFRIPSQQGAELEHILRRARRTRQAAVRAEQLRRRAGRSGAEEQAVLLFELRGVSKPRRRAVPPHRADRRDEPRGLFRLSQRGHGCRGAHLRSVDAVRHQQSRHRSLQWRLRHGAESSAVPRQHHSGQSDQPHRAKISGLSCIR